MNVFGSKCMLKEEGKTVAGGCATPM